MEPSRSAIVSPPSGQREALLFELAGHRFALLLSDVIELTRACALQELPKAPQFVLGMLNLRGQIVPVLDLRRRLSLPEAPLVPNDFFVFARIAQRRVGLRVDRLIGIESLPVVPTAEVPNLSGPLQHVAGVAAVADGVVLIYELESFLNGTESALLEAALAVAVSTNGGLP